MIVDCGTLRGFPGGSVVKKLLASAGDAGESIPGSGRSPGELEIRRSEWKPTPIFLPGESHGQRSLVGYGT